MSTGVVIRLKNLPNSAGTTDIRRFFNGLSIPDGGVHIIGGEDGTAFILFCTDEDARQAMLQDSQKISGEKIKLMLSSHTEMRKMIEESQRKYEELRGLRPPEPPITNLTSRSSATGSSVPKGQTLEAEGNDLYVELKNMPENVNENDLIEFFNGLPISAIRIVLNEKGEQLGQGFVRFRSQSSKIMALKKDRDFLGPRFVHVVPASEKQWAVAGSHMCETWRPVSEYQSRKRGKSSTPSNDGTPKRSRAFSPLRNDNCVELRGLPAAANAKTVQELFYHLKFTENGLYIESDGKGCRGRAFAEFVSMDDYKEALLKDGEILEGKQIRVINISRQGMADAIKHNKKYLKMKRDEEYKRERDELERKEHEKRQKEVHERQQKEMEEQKRTDDEQRKRRKQKEMEEWLARQHEKEESERKRQDRERRLEEERRMRAAEDDRIRREEERRRRDEEMRRREEEQRRHEYEMKRQREIDEMELRMKEEEKRRIKEELLKEELASMSNGKEVEMDIDSPARVDDLSEHYPPPPSDALLPVKPPPPRYSVAGSNPQSEYSVYKSPTGQRQRPDDSIRGPPPTSYPQYDRGRSPPPPLPSISRDRPPPIPPHAVPGLPPPPTILSPSHPHLPPASIPPPPLPPAIPVIRMPRDAFPPPTIPAPGKPPVPVVPIVVPPTLPPPVIVPPPTSGPPTDNGVQRNSGNTGPSVYCRLANAPYQVTEGEVRDFFRKVHVSPESVEFLAKDGKRSGHIFVKFPTEKDADEATKLDQEPLGGRDTLVRLAYPALMQQALKRFDTRNFEDLFKLKPPPVPMKDNLNLEHEIFRERLNCVRVANLPPNTVKEDILRTFSEVSILPNGVHILKNEEGKCSGSAFIEVVTPDDCLRAANLHGVGTVNGAVIRVMPLKQQDMDREIHKHHEVMFGRPPPGPPLLPHHPRLPVPPPIPPPHPLHHPPPIRPDLDLRLDHRPPMSRSPHHMNHRPASPPRGPPRPRSPPRGPPVRPMTPPLGPRSPRDLITREEMARRAQLYDIERRIEQERMMMRDLGPPGPFGDRLPGPPRFDRPGERPFPPGFPARLPPPHFVGDGPWRPKHPDGPRFRLPPTSVVVKMSNLSFHVTQEDILEFFLKFVPLPDSVRLMYNPSGRLTGEGYIAFPNREAADRAIRDLDKKPLLQRPIKLYLA